MKTRKKRWVVDLGIELTKLVVGFADDSGMIHIEEIRIEKTPEHYLANARTMGAFLRPLLKGYRRKDELILLINHNEMLVGTFTFPMMTLKEVEDAIFWKMQMLVSENIENWRIDFTVTERTQWLECLGIDDKKLDVLGIGIKKTLLREHYRVFKKSGFEINAIAPQFYTYPSLLNRDDDQPTLIIEMGKTTTRLYYYNWGALIENYRIELSPDWDGEIYLMQIIKVIEEILQSPLGYTKGPENGKIYLMGGESLHPGVRNYLSKKIEKEIYPTYYLLDQRDDLIFPRLMTKAELCLITPGMCGMIKWVQTKNSGGRP